MTWLYRTWVRPALFALDPEQAHERTLEGLKLAARTPLAGEALASFFAPNPLPVTAFGLRFPNPVGLAAGMDKFGEAVPAWERLGFGFCELGGVTWLPQPGNPPPRLFRIPEARAVINRMGFNNPGAEKLAVRLKQWRDAGLWPAHPVGINLGKSKDTPLERAAEDYARSFRALWDFADFAVVNVSSPNTPELRRLQGKEALREILEGLLEVNASLGKAASPSPSPRNEAAPARVSSARHRPVLVKVAPELTPSALDDILDLMGPGRIAGIIATNTTVERPRGKGQPVPRRYGEPGGLSGEPLRDRSTEVIRYLHTRTSGRLPVIGVGGIFNAQDAWEKVAAGATLLQVYTGLIYEGPGLTREIVEGLRERLAERGFRSLEEAVGSEAPRAL